MRSDRRSIVVAVAAATALSLLGDQLLYAVLPSHHAAAGIGVASLGVMLSIHRFIRLAANSLGGVLYDRFGRRRPFLLGMAFAALSTLGYWLADGFWPLLVARLVWGLAFALISVGGLSIVFDLTAAADRGRWVGLYQSMVGIGTLIGLLASGILTDLVGYRATLAIYTPLTALGWLVAFVAVRETGARPDRPSPALASLGRAARAVDRRLAILAFATFVNFFANHGVLMATLGAFVRQVQQSDAAGILALPTASLTGILLAARRLAAMLAAPVSGYLSDRARDRQRVAAAGALASLAGYAVLILASPELAIPLGVVLAALGEGVMAAALSAWAGDVAPAHLRGVLMGGFATVNDLGGATGPLVAYALGTAFGFRSAYALCVALLLAALLALVALRSAPAHARTATSPRP